VLPVFCQWSDVPVQGQEILVWLSYRVSTSAPTVGDPDVMEAPGSLSVEVTRVAVRLAPFWIERPAVWFA
jgi:hypothetical protein